MPPPTTEAGYFQAAYGWLNAQQFLSSFLVGFFLDEVGSQSGHGPGTLQVQECACPS